MKTLGPRLLTRDRLLWP